MYTFDPAISVLGSLMQIFEFCRIDYIQHLTSNGFLAYYDAWITFRLSYDKKTFH